MCLLEPHSLLTPPTPYISFFFPQNYISYIYIFYINPSSDFYFKASDKCLTVASVPSDKQDKEQTNMWNINILIQRHVYVGYVCILHIYLKVWEPPKEKKSSPLQPLEFLFECLTVNPSPLQSLKFSVEPTFCCLNTASKPQRRSEIPLCYVVKYSMLIFSVLFLPDLLF